MKRVRGLGLFAVIGVLALAACPPRRGGGGGGGGVGAPAGVGCPPASGVHVASYLTPDEGARGHTGWVLPLADKIVASLEGVPEYASLDAAGAAAAGVPAPPASLWMLVPGGQPCRLTVGGYYAAAIDAPTPNLTYGVELTGCPAPQDPDNASAIALVSGSSPGECQIVPPRPVATRLGEVGADKRWRRPTRDTPIPPAIVAVIPQRECKPPGCELLYSIGQFDVGGQPVAWAGAVNWLEAPAGAAPAPGGGPAAGPDPVCSWKAETFSGFFVAGPSGAPVKVSEGQDHPLALTAVLADRGGARLLLAEGPGEYTVYTLEAGVASVGRHLVWLRPHPDAYAGVDHLGPDCGP